MEIWNVKSGSWKTEDRRRETEPGTCWSEAKIPISRGNVELERKYRIANIQYSIMKEETVNVNLGSRKSCQRHPFGGRRETEPVPKASLRGNVELETLNETA